MSVSYLEIRNERQWKATTGLGKEDFISLCNSFALAYERLHEVSMPASQQNLRKCFALDSYEQALYFVLFQLKNDLSNDSLGVLFAMDGSNAWRNFKACLQVLELALGTEEALPKRSFDNVQAFKAYLRGENKIRIDVTEYNRQRPAQGQRQKACYSGKKKPIRVSP